MSEHSTWSGWMMDTELITVIVLLKLTRLIPQSGVMPFDVKPNLHWLYIVQNVITANEFIIKKRYDANLITSLMRPGFAIYGSTKIHTQ